MAKKKINKSETLIRKLIALGSAVIAFVFFFLEMIAVKNTGKNLLTGKKIVETEGVRVSDFLFSEDYKVIRESETFSSTYTILWIALVLVVVSIIFLVASLLLKNNSSLLAKIGSIVLVIGLIVMFGINTNKVEVLSTASYYTNITVLYFVALVLSGVGLVSVLGLKK